MASLERDWTSCCRIDRRRFSTDPDRQFRNGLPSGLIGYFGGAASLSAHQNLRLPEARRDHSPGQAFCGQFPLSRGSIRSSNQAEAYRPDCARSQERLLAICRRRPTDDAFFDSTGKSILAPAMFSASFGQNWTGDRGTPQRRRRSIRGLSGPSAGCQQTRYLSWARRFAASLTSANFGLQNADIALAPALDSSGNPIPVTDPGVAIIAVSSDRDLYSMRGPSRCHRRDYQHFQEALECRALKERYEFPLLKNGEAVEQVGFDQVRRDESLEIEARRERATDEAYPGDCIGLALSGSGIRSENLTQTSESSKD